MVQEAVEEPGDRGGVAKQGASVLYGEVGGQDRGRPLVAARNERQQVLVDDGRQHPLPQVVDDREGDGAELGKHRLPGAIQRGVGQLLQQLDPATPAGAVA
jgi:hypothetical protein